MMRLPAGIKYIKIAITILFHKLQIIKLKEKKKEGKKEGERWRCCSEITLSWRVLP